MRKFLVVAIALLLTGCDDKLEYPNKYPVIETEVATISKPEVGSGTDINFKGKVLELGRDYEVIRYGIVFSLFNNNPKLNDSDVFIVEAEDNTLKKGSYELFAHVTRTIGSCYYRAFVETGEVVVYGEVVTSGLLNN